MGEDEEPDEIVYETSTERVVERQPESSAHSGWVSRMGRRFRLQRREIVSRSGERTHLRVTYQAEDDPNEDASKKQNPGTSERLLELRASLVEMVDGQTGLVVLDWNRNSRHPVGTRVGYAPVDHELGYPSMPKPSVDSRTGNEWIPDPPWAGRRR